MRRVINPWAVSGGVPEVLEAGCRIPIGETAPNATEAAALKANAVKCAKVTAWWTAATGDRRPPRCFGSLSLRAGAQAAASIEVLKFDVLANALV